MKLCRKALHRKRKTLCCSNPRFAQQAEGMDETTKPKRPFRSKLLTQVLTPMLAHFPCCVCPGAERVGHCFGLLREGAGGSEESKRVRRK